MPTKDLEGALDVIRQHAKDLFAGGATKVKITGGKKGTLRKQVEEVEPPEL